MKLSTLLPLAASARAIVLPDPEIMSQIAIEDYSKQSIFDQVKAELPSKDDIKISLEETLSSLYESSKNTLDEAFDWASKELKSLSEDIHEEYFDAKSWVACSYEELKASVSEHPPKDGPPHGPPPHDGPPHDHPPHHGPPHHGPPHDHPPHHGPDHDRPHHPPHHRPHKSNQTVYELIASSKYTTKLAELINKSQDLVDFLNSTDANITIFAPTDKAFEKIPDHGKEPSDEIIKKVLSYHVSPEFYPAGRILVTRTVPTALEGKYLSSSPEDTPQRISTNIGLRGLTLNFYSRVVAPNIFGSNGVIHGIDSILLPPPKVGRIISLLPSEFSTLELALRKTGLWEPLNESEGHLGGTLFAPSNWAFQKLGPRLNAFLFSEYGLKYLGALLKYHAVPNATLYSDAFYSGGESDSKIEGGHRIPKGKFHIDLPTYLENTHLSIDIGRFGRLIDIRINGFAHVAVPDGIAKDGVIHGLSNVLIPPKKVGGKVDYLGEEISVEELKERLQDYITNDNENEEGDKHDL